MTEKIAVVDYNAGNIRSVLYALDRLGVRAQLTADPDLIYQADKVIFPGVGEASTTMAHLNASGMADCIRSLKQPVFAICVGQQLVCGHSEEGDVPCLGIFEHMVLRFSDKDKKVPHMGWNTLHDLKGPLFDGVEEGSYVYFVHSYYVEENADMSAKTIYGHPFAAAMERDNFFCTQFHPEKSAHVGEHIMANFLKL